ncbi:uncharacterized protein LOC111064450 [Nilaparvata lugens]|uniref:uncharacterized protein LOC111064450 n=1 Tax=Nilaparvata lugens TaxID=108931 RepID=UPI00193EAFEE|nr:uncharacterized protein LOC111064450 [Nilaparvata lugens]
MPYRNSHPSSIATATAAPRRPAPVYRHRGVVLPAKLTLPYGQSQPQGSLDVKYAQPQTDFRKFYKKAPEVSVVRKPSSPYKFVQSSITDSGSKFTTSPYKDDYTKSYKTKQTSSSPYKSSHTSDSSNENYNGFSSQETDPLPDPFSKSSTMSTTKPKKIDTSNSFR